MANAIQQKNNVDTVDKTFFPNSLLHGHKEHNVQSANVYLVEQQASVVALICTECRQTIASRVGAVIYGSNWFHQECWNSKAGGKMA
ncbi:MAG: hypothetical protein QXG67_04910 [Candidatus Nitrosotenuis sp.]